MPGAQGLLLLPVLVPLLCVPVPPAVLWDEPQAALVSHRLMTHPGFKIVTIMIVGEIKILNPKHCVGL